MNKCYLPAVFLFSVMHLQAQNESKGFLKGRVADTTLHQVLNQATITILNAKDSSVSTFGLTDDKGLFAFKNVPFGNYILQVAFSGYETRYKSFQLSKDSAMLDAGTIYMQLHSNDLGNVTVEAVPILIKKDTVEYAASMFATKPNATVGDLLNKLPGVDVDKNGNVKAQGESVQRVLVNGKRFFGDDPKMATQNLPPDVVDKIQVYDAMSDQSDFTGFDDGNRVKTINIITKKNAQHGYFGKAIAGVGNKGLYDEGASINRFDGEQQISFIGQANNTNKQNFSVQDILGGNRRGYGGRGGGYGGRNSGGMRSSQSSGGFSTNNNGITHTLAAGLNYRDAWGKNTSAYGSYFYNNLLTAQEQKTATENLIPNDSSIFNDQDMLSQTRSINQRFNFNIESQFDSSNSIILRPNGSYQQTNASSQSTTNTTKGKITPLNNSIASSNRQNEGYNGSIDMLFRHRFHTKGRTFSVDINGGGNSNNGNGNNISSSEYFIDGSDSVHNINQQYISKTKGQNLSTTLSYTEPAGKHAIIEFNYNYAYNKNTAERITYDFDSATQKFSSVDSLLTNNYDNTYHSNRFTLNYRIQKNKLHMSFGSGVQFGDLTSINASKNLTLTQHYTNIYPTANFNYRFSNTSNLRFNYSGRTAQPNVQQLQPVIDNTDPLNVQVGNPTLKQSFTNSFRMLFVSFDRTHFHNIFATVNASFIHNDIVSAITTNPLTGADTITSVNLDGTYNLSAFFNYGFQLKKPKSNLNFTTNFTDSRTASLINHVRNFTTNYTIGETVKFTTNLKKNFDMSFSATPTYNIARYSVQPELNEKYFSQVLNTDVTFYTKDGWILEANFDYTAYAGRAAGFNTSVPLLNAAIAKQLFKNKQGELRLSVFDLLNQNVSITRNVTENYIQDVQTKVLTRYALLTFTYNLRNFAAPQKGGPTFYRNRNGEGG